MTRRPSLVHVVVSFPRRLLELQRHSGRGPAALASETSKGLVRTKATSGELRYIDTRGYFLVCCMSLSLFPGPTGVLSSSANRGHHMLHKIYIYSTRTQEDSKTASPGNTPRKCRVEALLGSLRTDHKIRGIPRSNASFFKKRALCLFVYCLVGSPFRFAPAIGCWALPKNHKRVTTKSNEFTTVPFQCPPTLFPVTRTHPLAMGVDTLHSLGRLPTRWVV